MLSDRNIFCPLGGGEKQRGPMPLGHLLFFSWSLAPDLLLLLGQTNIHHNRQILIKVGVENY